MVAATAFEPSASWWGPEFELGLTPARRSRPLPPMFGGVRPVTVQFYSLHAIASRTETSGGNALLVTLTTSPAPDPIVVRTRDERLIVQEVGILVRGYRLDFSSSLLRAEDGDVSVDLQAPGLPLFRRGVLRDGVILDGGFRVARATDDRGRVRDLNMGPMRLFLRRPP